jgi:hypothetical protein
MNLLPNTEKDALRQSLKLRSLVLLLFLMSVSFFLGFIVLVPSYFLALGNYNKISSENYLSTVKDENLVKTILNLPQEIDSKLKVMQSINNNISVADSIFEIIKYLPSKVNIHSISLSKNQSYDGKTGEAIVVSGVASSRESLVLFSNSLKASSLFADVVVPVSSLTKNKDLPFSISIFIKN